MAGVAITPDGFAVSFSHGWDAALNEAIDLAETIEFEGKSVSALVQELKKLRDANQ